MPRTASSPPAQAVLIAIIIACLLLAVADTVSAGNRPTGLSAEGHDVRIDLVWDRASDTDQDLFNIYRAERADGPWKMLNARPHTIHVYSDFIGKNGKTYYYRVTQWIDELRKDSGLKWERPPHRMSPR